ncbi:unnamed protein product [Effrenium voratum]|nr:unnamed protein product [Effrenium voratum]
MALIPSVPFPPQTSARPLAIFSPAPTSGHACLVSPRGAACAACALTAFFLRRPLRAGRRAENMPEPPGAAAEGEMAGGSYEIMKTSGVEWTKMFKAADDFAKKNNLRKLGDSKDAAAKWAAFYPDESVRGLRDWLDGRGLRRHFDAVNEWCKTMGADDIMDLIENTEDLEPSIFTGWQIGLQDIVEYLGEELSQTERETLLGRKWSGLSFLLPEAGERRCGRREALAAGLYAGFQATSALALNDARQDSICSYKCLATCNQKAPNNDEYCQKACKLYCEQSKAERELRLQTRHRI